MRSASELYNDIFEALTQIEESADRAAAKVVINHKDYLAMLIDTMVAPFVKENITKAIRGVATEVESEQLDLFSM